MTELFIKNMVCDRCIMVVRQELVKNGFEPVDIQLGLVSLNSQIEQTMLSKLAEDLQLLGFELLDDTKSRLIEQMKTVIIQKIHHAESLEMTINWSDLLAMELSHEYKYLSNLFSSVEGMTVEHYIIRQKIERVKEFLFYKELTLSEISYRLGYSSVQHLSQQFKKTTGQTPSQFKTSRTMDKKRNSLDSV